MLSITQVLQPIRTSHTLFCMKSPKSAYHDCLTSQSTAAEPEASWFWIKPSKQVLASQKMRDVSSNLMRQIKLIWTLDSWLKLSWIAPVSTEPHGRQTESLWQHIYERWVLQLSTEPSTVSVTVSLCFLEGSIAVLVNTWPPPPPPKVLPTPPHPKKTPKHRKTA